VNRASGTPRDHPAGLLRPQTHQPGDRHRAVEVHANCSPGRHSGTGAGIGAPYRARGATGATGANRHRRAPQSGLVKRRARVLLGSAGRHGRDGHQLRGRLTTFPRVLARRRRDRRVRLRLVRVLRVRFIAGAAGGVVGQALPGALVDRGVRTVAFDDHSAVVGLVVGPHPPVLDRHLHGPVLARHGNLLRLPAGEVTNVHLVRGGVGHVHPVAQRDRNAELHRLLRQVPEHTWGVGAAWVDDVETPVAARTPGCGGSSTGPSR
jgi:hypothetical protein